ncbi:hypothetical protein [Candidatus Amarolinea aalborgensis]|uniref:hypothetical protein n=1 Tax=Candidatus Amarolinea aalborgensis TaxID=2249329 RepID=UPI003BF9CF53
MSKLSVATPSRWLRWAQIAWMVVVAVALLMFVAGSAVYYGQLRQVCTAAAAQCAEFDYATPTGVAQLAARGLSLDAYALLRLGILVVYALIPLTLGLLIFARKRSEPIALLVSFFLITFGTIGNAQSVLAAAYPAFALPAKIIGLLATVSLPLFFGLFPNGRMIPRLYWLAVAYFGVAFFLQDTLGLISIGSPLGSFLAWTGWPLVLLGGVAAQIYRYRRVSNSVEQRQTRWVLFGMGAMAILMVVLLAYIAITGDPTLGTTADRDLLRRSVFLIVGNLMFQVIFLSMGLAILRSNLFDIDVIIRKTLVYTVVTALLALIYFGGVILLQRLVGSLTGVAQSPLAVVVSTLAIAALFTPLRRRIQDVIDRRFYRKKYDATQVLAQFAVTARDETDLDALTGELARVVQETLQPEGVSVWLFTPDSAQGRR